MTAGSIDMPAAQRLSEKLERQRLAFYADLGQRQLGALWNMLDPLLTPRAAGSGCATHLAVARCAPTRRPQWRVGHRR